MHRSLLRLCAVVALTGCGPSQAPPGARPYFDLEAASDASGHFFDFPFPSDLRLDEDGTPNLRGFPANARGGLLNPLVAIADARRGFSTMSVTYFRFSEPLRSLRLTNLVAPSPASDLLLIDIDPGSPDRGTLLPLVATTLGDDSSWSPGHVLAVAPYPGVILAPDRSYAVVVTTNLRAEDGRPILVADDITRMSKGQRAKGNLGHLVQAAYEPLWDTLDTMGIPRNRVAVASVFTTGDVVSDLSRLAERTSSAYAVTIDDIRVDPSDGADHSRYCELLGTATVPQFQAGAPPFHDGGVIEMDGDGVPVAQRMESIPVVLTVPRQPMPSEGYPLMLYLHGSGGTPSELVDRGRMEFDGSSVPGTGPAHVVAEHGIGAFAPALPLTPDRYPNAAEQEYLNFANLGAFPGTFHQGVLEQRLLLDALGNLTIPASSISACGAPITSQSQIRFDMSKVVASGQSMGGMYTNMVAATDPRIGAVVPTGAGGFWHWMLLSTRVIDDMDSILGLLFGSEDSDLNFAHPGLSLMALAWEPAEPLVFMPRITSRPLPGHPSRSVYQPIGLGDEYFSPEIYDAAVLAFGNQLAGDEIWPSSNKNLGVGGSGDLGEYPLSANRTSQLGAVYTGVAVQFRSDGVMDAHYIAAQLDSVKYQYGCFLRSYLATGVGTVPAPAPSGTSCPE